jgi:hypothetical protein
VALSDWLAATVRDPRPSHFDLEEVVEAGAPDAAVVATLAAAIVEAKSDRQFLEKAASVLGWGAVAPRVAGGRVAVRRGDFGEALTAAWLDERHGVQTPVPKLRYQVSRDQTQPGTDIVGLTLNAPTLGVAAIHLIECKLRTRRNLAAGADAHLQLVEHRATDFAEVLLFILERLYFENRPLYDALLEHLAGRQASGHETDRYEIALVYDEAAWDERVVRRIEDVAGELVPLRVHSIRIADLAELVDRAFEGVAGNLVIDDDPEDLDDSDGQTS